MGNYLQWKPPSVDEDQSIYDLTEIWRSSTQNGSYSLLTTVTFGDIDYYDIDGAATDWYKIRFKDTGETKYSAYSTAIQAGTQKVYCSSREVVDLAGINGTTLPDNLSWDRIGQLCADASQEVDGITKTIHGRTASFDEYFDSNTLSLGRFIQLPYRNLATISSVQLQYSDSTWDTLTSGIGNDYETDLPKGRVYLHWPLGKTLYSGFRDIRIQGTYGNSTVSDSIRTLTKYLAAIRLLASLTGGAYNSVQSYSMGKVSYNLGNQAGSLQAASASLGAEALMMANRLGLSLTRTSVRVH